MISHEIIQGSKEWDDLRKKYLRTASRLPAVMNCSKYDTRDDLLNQLSTGAEKDHSAFTEGLFEKGHAAEAGARPITEGRIDAELFPTTVVTDDEYLLASLDGMTMCESILFEHKLWSDRRVNAVNTGMPEEDDRWQMDQQLLITGAEKVIYVVSDGTADNMVWLEYHPDPARLAQIIPAWQQFDKDLENYEPIAEVEVIEAAPIRDLPAIVYKLDGLALTSNLDVFKAAAEQLVEDSKLPLETDQDFADRKKQTKAMKEAEEKIKLVQAQVVGEIKDVDLFRKDLGFIGETIRQARLNGEKLVAAREKEIRAEIANKAGAELQTHISDLNKSLAPITMPIYAVNFTEVIKGRRTKKSLHEACNDALATAKIELDATYRSIHSNLQLITEMAGEHGNLFPDRQQLVMKAADDLELLINSRLEEHRRVEAERLEAERKKIREEEERKAHEAMVKKERGRIAEERKELAKAEEERQKKEAEVLPEPEVIDPVATSPTGTLERIGRESSESQSPAAYTKSDSTETPPSFESELDQWAGVHGISPYAMNGLRMIISKHMAQKAA